MREKKQFLIIGLGRFGSSVLLALTRAGYEVLALDVDEEIVQKMSSVATQVVIADSTDEDTLQALGVRNFDVAVVAIGNNIEANVFTTLLLKNLGLPMIVAKAQNDLHGKMLEKIGADHVVYPEYDMGQRVAHNLITNSVLDYIELSPEIGVVELKAPKSLVGFDLIGADLRNKFEVNVVAIKVGDEVIAPPAPDQKINASDILVLVGKIKGISALENLE